MAKLNTCLLTKPVVVTNLSHEGRGIAHVEGKTTFIDNALPGETVTIHYTKKHRQYDEASAIEILTASPNRVTPKCAHYMLCGGCSLQHLDTSAQLQHKEKNLLTQLKQLAGVKPKHLLPAITASNWGYRRRARLGVKYVTKKQTVLVGFREKNGRYLAQLQGCETLDARISQLIPALQTLIHSMQAYQSIPQIEVSMGDEQLALVVRHLIPLNTEDTDKLISFAKQQQLQLYLQPGNASSIACVWPESNSPPLTYYLNPSPQLDKRLEFFFKPTHFIQINATVNQAMVSHAMELLALNFSDQILDLFCGLGNFSLALATRCRRVVGVEGSLDLVQQARENAMHNAVSNVEFYSADLSHPLNEQSWTQQAFNKLLLDPPRSGALSLVQQLSTWPLERIVYVSCNPATLARDTGELIKQGYVLEQAGVIDMFSHTQHSETICLFTK